MASVKLTLDTRSTKKDGTHPVKLYVTHYGDFYISTGISITSEQWTEDEKKPTGIRLYDAPLVQMLTQVRSTLYQLRADGRLENMDKQALKAELSNFTGKPKVESAARPVLVADQFRELIDSKSNAGTRATYMQSLTKLQRYYDLEKLSFSDISTPWLRDFESKMRDDGLVVNAIGVHMRNLRAVINRAIDDELVDQNNYPFRKFKIKTERTAKRSLSVEHLRLLRDYSCQIHQQRYRDIFMLIFYLIGINMVDLVQLSEVTSGRIDYRRAKTRRLYSIKVEPEAQVIIEKYRGKEQLLNILDDYVNYKDFMHRMNGNLQEIGPVEWVANGASNPRFVKRNKKKIEPLFPAITTYWARHSWATIAAGLEIPRETIAAALGHGGDSVTDIYIDFDRRKVDAANRKVIDYVNGQLNDLM